MSFVSTAGSKIAAIVSPLNDDNDGAAIQGGVCCCNGKSSFSFASS